MAFVPAALAAIPAWVSTAFTVGSGVVGAVGAVQGANATAAAAEYNAKQSEADALVADQNRKSAMQTAALAAEDKRRENRRLISSIRAGYGGSGLTMEGSPLDVLADSATEAELDAQRIEYEGQASARDAALGVMSAERSGNLSRMEASGARATRWRGAGSSLLSAGGRALSRTA